MAKIPLLNAVQRIAGNDSRVLRVGVLLRQVQQEGVRIKLSWQVFEDLSVEYELGILCDALQITAANILNLDI